MTKITPRKSQHGQWSSRFAFIMAATGAAVGLGNIWKFPYMAGDNGGGAFVLIYLIAILLVGIPAMIAEIMLGRIGRQNPINSLRSIADDIKASKHWQLVGVIGAFTLLLVLSFYSVVAGWSLAYIGKTLNHTFIATNANQILAEWTSLLNSPKTLLLWHSVFMVMTLSVVAFGVKRGIERASKIMMPALFLVLIVLALYAATVGDGMSAIKFLFLPDFSKITIQVIIDALGHAFFTLAIGAGAMLVYGAYLDKKTNIGSTVFIIAILDVIVAILAGLAIFPILFAYNLSPQEGPGLMFKVLPLTFANMPFGQTIGLLFFILLLFTAWTSSLSMAEPLVALLVEKFKLKRLSSALIVGAVAWALGIVSLLSFNIYSDIKIFNRDVFSNITDLATNILLPIGGLLLVVFAGFILPKSLAKAELQMSNCKFNIWHFVLKWITPLAILVVMIESFIN